jgi:hypothetical protein
MAFRVRLLMAHSTAKCNGRQKTGIHNTAKSGRRNGQPVE